MEPKFWKKLFVYVLTRVLLSTAVVCLFTFGVITMIADTATVVVITIPFAAAMCLYTTVIIFRHVKYLLTAPMIMILKSADMLKMASMNIAISAADMCRNTSMMKDFAYRFDKATELNNGKVPKDDSIS